MTATKLIDNLLADERVQMIEITPELGEYPDSFFRPFDRKEILELLERTNGGWLACYSTAEPIHSDDGYLGEFEIDGNEVIDSNKGEWADEHWAKLEEKGN